ncbi:hypothetical protein LCGC14_2774670 [marine sediment metagenome]|uniref:Uncharacterized protein n=1 Tax=marine sediment metagenome TaxID=412755 RepID=A0A0F8YV16_9ZZZZ
MTTASEWADKITDAAKSVPGSLSWDEVHCLIFEALCKAEADGFRRGLEKAVHFIINGTLLPAVVAGQIADALHTYMEKPDE